MKRFMFFAAVPILIGMALTEIVGAQTWQSLNGPRIVSDVKDISVTTSGSTLYIADANYVFKSTNSGTGWAVTPQPYPSPLLVLVKPNDGNVVLAAKNGELAYNPNGGGGNEWTPKITDANLVPLRLVAAVTDNNIMLLGRTWVAGNNSIWRSPDGGLNWSRVTGFTDTTNIHDFSSYPVDDPGDPDRKKIIWAGGVDPYGSAVGGNRLAIAKRRGVWVSHNYGVNWTASTLGDYDIRSVAIVERSSPTNYHLYAACSVPGANDTLFKSINIGGVWTPIFHGVGEIRLVRVNRSTGTIFLATNDGVYRSTDAYSTNGGGTWSKLTGFPESDVKSIAVGSGSVVFAATASSLYKSTDNGSTWTDVASGISTMNRGWTERQRATRR